MRVPPIALLPLLAVTLSGCDGGSVPMLPSPSATPAVFESEEEALAAATETYERYLTVTSQILNDGGADPDRIDDVASPTLAATEKAGYELLAGSGKRYLGVATVSATVLQSWSATPDALGVLATIDACLDLSLTDVVDAFGVSLVNEDRPERASWEITITKHHAVLDRFVVASKQPSADDVGCRSK